MSNTVSFRIEITDSGSFKTVSLDATEFGKCLDEIKDRAKRLNNELVNAASISQVAESAKNAINQLATAFGTLSKAYYEDEVAANTLAMVMSNTMDATEEEVQELIRFVRAQEKVGVVSAGVQTAAARELSTYLSLTSSLKTLIPVLNDMGVHQYGVGVSAEQLTQIATMMGKVMDGQTEALSRAGYKFDDAQKHILKFGEESERAAVLAQVVSESVGGINASSVETAAGKMQQFQNEIGGVMSALGGVVSSINPFIQGFAGLVVIAANMAQVKQSLKALGETMAVTKLKSLGLAAAEKVQAKAQQLLAAAGIKAAAGTMALRAATLMLYGAMTFGISLAIQALITLFTKLGQKGKEAAEGIDDAKEAQDAFKSASMDMRVKLAEEIIKLEDLIKKKKATASTVKELNSQYGKIFGSHATAKEWYEVLTKKSGDYCKQLGLEAKVRALIQQKAEKENERDELNGKASALRSEFDAIPQGKSGRKKIRMAEEINSYIWQARDVSDAIQNIDKQIDEAVKEASSLADGMKDTNTVSEDAEKRAEKLADDIKDYKTAVENAASANSVFGGSTTDVDARLKAMKSGLTSLINKYGTESTAIQNLIAEYGKLARERSKANDLGDFKPTALPDSYNVKEFKDGRMTDRKVSSKVTGLNTALNIPRPTRSLTDFEQAVELYKKLQNQLATASPEAAKGIREAMDELDRMYDITGRGGTKLEKTIDTFGTLSNVMRGLSGVVGEAAGAWLEWGANLLQVIAQALPQLSTLFAAHTADAAASAADSVASVPYVGPVLAVAAIASVLAAMAAVPKFANGGIAYGPTLGLFGEYSNASSNPEVVAPLDRLRSLIGDGSQMYGDVRFEIEGSKLVGVLERRYNKLRRTNG